MLRDGGIGFRVQGLEFRAHGLGRLPLQSLQRGKKELHGTP